MLEIPYLDEIVMEKSREAARATANRHLMVLREARFGDVPRDLVEEIGSIVDEKQLESLVRSPGTCPDLSDFRRATTRG